MKTKRPYFHSIILSDVHLGTPDSKTKEVIAFLCATRCKTLILNGDIVDGWALKRNSKWLPIHTKFVRTVLKKVEKQGTEVIYLRGNHDDVLDRFLPMSFPGIRVESEYVHPTPRGDYLVVHGDGFDSVTTDYRWVAKAGSVGYELLLRINRFYNKWRHFRGKPYYSLSKEIKSRVKSSVSFVGRYEHQLVQLAKYRKCAGVICGHIHTAADKQLEEGIHYLNSGDWVESLTAIVEPVPGEFQLVEYESFMDRGDAKKVSEETAVEYQESEVPVHPAHGFEAA